MSTSAASRRQFSRSVLPSIPSRYSSSWYENPAGGAATGERLVLDAAAVGGDDAAPAVPIAAHASFALRALASNSRLAPS